MQECKQKTKIHEITECVYVWIFMQCDALIIYNFNAVYIKQLVFSTVINK